MSQKPFIKLHLLVLFLLGISSVASSQNYTIPWEKQNDWVDSMMSHLTEEEKIAQLMIVAVWTQRDNDYIKEIDHLITDYKIGGLMFMKGTPHKQVALTNTFQLHSKVPLLISIDAEWGLSMRLDSTPVFPRQLVLGATGNAEFAKEMGSEIAKDCRRMGVNINFAPDVDVNNNPLNPVINDRSFGENKQTVARLGWSFAKGMQEQHVLATAKHFPGHGDTETDSHSGLPVINASRKRLDSLELYPFKELIRNGVGGIMVGHLFIPALDSLSNTASSISKPTVSGLLKHELGFKGLVITDGLNMKGVAGYVGPGEVSAKAMAAGNDMLLFVEDVPQSIVCIKEYIKKGIISSEQLNASCKRVLELKYWAGLTQTQHVSTENLLEDLNCCNSEVLIKKIVKSAIVIAKNQDDIIPIINPEAYKIASVAVGNNQFTAFQQTLNNYIHADYFSIDKNDSASAFDSLFSELQHYNLVILSLHNTSRFVSKKLGLTQLEVDFVNRVIADRKTILVNHGNPYIFRQFPNVRNAILAFEDLPLYNQTAAQALMGAFSSNGTMPVSVTSGFELNNGIKTEAVDRFEYVLPEEIGLDHSPLAMIDTIVNQGIAAHAMPGCQVIAAKNGKVFYQKSFGRLTYDPASEAVQNHDMYDLASLTKILATTLAVMKLVEDGKIKLTDRLGLFIPALRGTAKEKILIKDVLLHQAGFVPFIPFYKGFMKSYGLDSTLFRSSNNDGFVLPVAEHLYAKPELSQQIINEIALSELKTEGSYVYSDLGFILLRRVVEVISNQHFEDFVNATFYKPLNLSCMTFNPLSKSIPLAKIAPTENDTSFRKCLVWGTVHDPAAALQGCISGNAGLFANANDVAIIMQMLINGGTYGGVKIFKSSTVELFTKKQNKKSRRGLGFDKPEMTEGKVSPTGKLASAQTFGHTGFTGTCAWADPKNGLVYVFLSNRVYPDAENKKLAEMNIRTKIQDLLYEEFKRK